MEFRRVLFRSASSEEQQHVSVRGHPGGRQNPQRFSHAGAALPDQRSAQRILVQVGLARDFAAVAAAQLNGGVQQVCEVPPGRSEEHTSELQSLMSISYAVFCLKKNKTASNKHIT